MPFADDGEDHEDRRAQADRGQRRRPHPADHGNVHKVHGHPPHLAQHDGHGQAQQAEASRDGFGCEPDHRMFPFRGLAAERPSRVGGWPPHSPGAAKSPRRKRRPVLRPGCGARLTRARVTSVLTLGNFAAAQTARADANLLRVRGARDLGLHRMQVHVPAAAGLVVGVRNVIAELRAFAADMNKPVPCLTPKLWNRLGFRPLHDVFDCSHMGVRPEKCQGCNPGKKRAEPEMNKRGWSPKSDSTRGCGFQQPGSLRGRFSNQARRQPRSHRLHYSS